MLDVGLFIFIQMYFDELCTIEFNSDAFADNLYRIHQVF